MKVDNKWLPRENPKFQESDKQKYIVRTAEYMYSLAPFYKIILMINMILDDVIFLNVEPYIHIPPKLRTEFKQWLLFTVVKLKPHHTKSIVEYNDGSCDTFEM